MNNSFVTTAVAVATTCVVTSSAVAHEDIGIAVTGGKIRLSGSVFGAHFGEAGVPNTTSDPGFDGPAGTFPAAAPVGFNILDAARKWDGSDFDAVAAETITVSTGISLSRTTPATADTTVAGYTLNAASDGSWHRHLDFTLGSPAVDGFYLLKLELFTTAPNIAKSDPFFIVFHQGEEDELAHDAAKAFVESNLVPEPATLSLVGLGGMALLARRRRA